MMDTDAIWREYLTPDAALEVEHSGNVVLATPERRVTITNVARWVESLEIAGSVARASFRDGEFIGVRTAACFGGPGLRDASRDDPVNPRGIHEGPIQRLT